MIRDYKFNNKLTDRRGKHRGRMGIYLASSVLAGVLVALGLHDTEATLSPGTSPTTRPAAPQVVSENRKPLVISTPLHLPGQPALESSGEELHQAARPAAVTNPQGPQVSLLNIGTTETGRTLKPTPPAETDSTAALATPPAAGETPRPQTEAPTVAPSAEAEAPAQPDAPGEGLALEDTSLLAPPEATGTWKTHEIAKGETLAGIFKQYQLSATTVYRVVHAGKDAKALARIRPGQQLKLQIGADGQLRQLIFIKSRIESLRVSRNDDEFQATLDNKKVEHKVASVTGIIESSLFVDGQKAGLTDSQIMELAEIFGWDIDFALEIRAGDQFRVIYDQQFVDGEKFRNGPILAAEFVNRGRTYQAFRYETQDQISYYDADGHSKRRAFIRTPIRFARISSRFTRKRWHPIQKKWKSHKGVDYAAPSGTPIKVTGNGRVIFRGRKNGYGRVVIVQHSSKYRTVYAHMSKFRGSVKKGTRVKQGQVIGYVGQSGWATGPHLHYEFRVNNVQRNPLTVKLPKSLPLPKRQLAAYKRKIAPLTQQLASIRQSTMVARADH